MLINYTNISHQSQQYSLTKFSHSTQKRIELSVTIDTSMKPIYQSLKKISTTLENKVDGKFQEALAQIFIEPVDSPSAWVSHVVIILRDGDTRFCIDIRRVNKAILRENYPLRSFGSFITRLKCGKYFSILFPKNAYHQLPLDEQRREITS